MNGLIEAVGQIVAAHASKSPMTSEEIVAEIAKVHSTLSTLNDDSHPKTVALPAVPIHKAFRKSEVICLLCGKAMKSLTRHLATTHAMKPKEYRNRFGIPRQQSLTALSFSALRRDMAIARGLPGYLVKARAVRQENLSAKRTAGRA
ncbi:MucR family transcriptional regulator [Geomonas anaerohicana]|uniref:MucR family transcriptional regulator n=1 Tax=Geomonas anaerohicana TaxID=2798583 RepID=A0ABS0YAY0_9BACT|nr:MucR family transcriptional regulator [Geomonas anaerohicana]MBJ6749471.1 MucR family transcriptional regulator [Geomonas anaerohicana]